MKQMFIVGLLLASIFGSMAFYHKSTTPAWAGDESLSQTTVPAAGDVFKFYDLSTGNLVGVNWAFLSRSLVQGVNWTGFNITTTGAANWNYVGS